MLRPVAALALLATTALAGEARTILALSGLTCAACVPAVTRALEGVEGVRDVHINDDRTRAVVVGDARVSPQALTEAVRRLGYVAEVVRR
jgi:copper chaperone CopZ